MTATHETPVAPAEAPGRGRSTAVWLGLILLVATVLRVWSIDHGLPYSYNLDERAHFVPHAVTMTGGDLNPGYFINPPLLTYLLAAYLSIIHLGGVEQWFASDPTAVFTAARLISVAVRRRDGRRHLRGGAGLVRPHRRPGRRRADGRRVPAGLLHRGSRSTTGRASCRARSTLWCAAIVLRTGSRNALLAGGAAVGAAASFKYSDGAVVIALVAAAFLRPALSIQQALKYLTFAGLISIAFVIVTNPYLFPDWGVFTNDLDRQRKFASGPPLLGQPERNGWVYYVKSSRWALGILPGLLAFAGGIALLVKGKRREALVLGALIVLYFLYMGSQSRFYARWMLPLYPALAILAAYALIQVRNRAVFGALIALMLIPSTYTTVRNALVLGREDTRSITRDWLVANVPQGTKVVFEPIAPTEWYGVTPGGGPKADPARQWERSTRSQALIAELRKEYRGAGYPANFQNYERTLFPGMLDVYRASTPAGSSPARRSTAARGPRPTACRRRSSTTGRCAARPRSRSRSAR